MERQLLSVLDIELTERCNNNCAHCFINLPANDKNAEHKELPADKIKEILKEAASLGCLIVRFTGGEPLLRKDFRDLYVFTRKLGLKVIIFTNATLITPDLADLFARIPPLERIEVSVYGIKVSSYESNTRKPGSFDAAWRGIDLLLQKKVPFVVKSALLPFNKNEIEEFECWAKKLPWMKGIAPKYSMFFDLRARRCHEKNNLIKMLRVSPEEGVRFFVGKKDTYIKEMKLFCSRFIGPQQDKLFACGAGIKSGCLDAYGYFQPCLLLRHPDTAYDLKKGSLYDALVRFFPKVREAKAANAEYLARCAKCFLKGLCEQCPAKSYAEHGMLDTPVEYLCDIAHAEARFLGLLKPEESAWKVTHYADRIAKFSGKSAAETIKV